jgi:hypothetical protein
MKKHNVNSTELGRTLYTARSGRSKADFSNLLPFTNERLSNGPPEYSGFYKVKAV